MAAIAQAWQPPTIVILLFLLFLISIYQNAVRDTRQFFVSFQDLSWIAPNFWDTCFQNVSVTEHYIFTNKTKLGLQSSLIFRVNCISLLSGIKDGKEISKKPQELYGMSFEFRSHDNEKHSAVQYLLNLWKLILDLKRLLSRIQIIFEIHN